MGRCIAPGAAFNALDPGVLFDDLSLFLEATGGSSAISGLAISCALSSETFFLLLLLAADASVPPRRLLRRWTFCPALPQLSRLELSSSHRLAPRHPLAMRLSHFRARRGGYSSIPRTLHPRQFAAS